MSELVIAFNRSVARVNRLIENVQLLLPKAFSKISYSVIERTEADSNLAYVHPITYMVVMNEKDEVFMYQRGGKGKETRLHGKYSIGIGGHVNPIDSNDLLDTIIAGANEELNSELGITDTIVTRDGLLDYQTHPPMIIYTGKPGHIEPGNDTVNDYHFGILKLVKVHSSQLGKHEDGVITKGEFVPIKAVKEKLDAGLLEEWSNRAFVLYLMKGDGTI